MAEVKIYTTPTCPYCHAALALLNEKGVSFEQIDVSGDRETRAWLLTETKQSTVPQVFIDGVSYGGFSDVSALDRAGKLDPLLK